MLRTTDSPRIWRLESADAMHVPSLRALIGLITRPFSLTSREIKRVNCTTAVKALSLPVSWHNLVSEASAKTNSADETSGSDKSQETKEN
ncbi:hypothetical protein H9L39_04626 [Fusarium oxysporum f. sp. albedinis]|nr:hypothetical protein H9L39_04626 [Fusarium oxysporum f. sp. albedinis]